MKIVYIARHGNGHNDDEGAIAYALEQLGHEVVLVSEATARRTHEAFNGVDFFLGHKFETVSKIKRLRMKAPYVFWYFDLVNTKGDHTLKYRNAKRTAWMRNIRRVASLGFCTDGDWVEESPNSKEECGLIHLFQGFDERLLLPISSPQRQRPKIFDVYFGGTLTNCGIKRNNWFNSMVRIYGRKFRHSVEAFREDCRDEVDQCRISIAPNFPVTNRYHSNRVYNFCGYGACLLHPYSERLARDYENRDEIVFYDDEDDMYSQIDWCLSEPDWVQRIGQQAQERTAKEHLYRHRCERLVEIVADRFDISKE